MADYPPVYYVPGPMNSHEPLASESIQAGLSLQARSLLTELALHREVDSTNAEVMRRLGGGSGSGLVVSAEQQTAGRGRHGRRWVSPPGANIYLSTAWVFERGVDAMSGLSLAVGVAVADALSEAGVADVSLKWPNDVLHQGAKLGGILVETAGGGSGPVSAVVGIGINCRMPDSSAQHIDQAWTDIQRVTGEAVDRSALLSVLLNHLLPLLASFESDGFTAWRSRWLERNAHQGQSVTLSSGQSSVSGRVQGIDESGALLLDVGGMLQAFSGGEISLRADR